MSATDGPTFYTHRGGPPPLGETTAVWCAYVSAERVSPEWPEEVPVVVIVPVRGYGTTGWSFRVPFVYLRGPRGSRQTHHPDGVHVTLVRIAAFACLLRAGVPMEDILSLDTLSPLPGPPWPGVFEPLLPPVCWAYAEGALAPTRGRQQGLQAFAELVAWQP